MDKLLDNSMVGPLYLRRPEIAHMMIESLYYHEGHLEHFHLHKFVVMANHVHLLITPRMRASKLTQSLKRYTAREANRILGMTGRFWQDESYDRLVRDQREFERIGHYIEMNPVKAGLVSTPEEFPWSSARPIGQSAAGCQPAPH